MTSNGTATAIPVVEDGLADTPETGTGAGKPIKVPVATWPAAVPSDEEAHVMSIICGNSHLHWALHNDAREENLNPNLFWRTPHLMENDVNVESTAESLSRHVPKYAHDVIFGISENGTAKAALEASRKRPEAARLFSVYIISTNLDQLQYLARLWSDVPCRIFQLEGDAFYSAEDGRYDGMGVDRLATLRGAGEQWGYPALVFDGGTATTYTAADSNGHIMGGGIGPGVALKVGSLGEGCDALPDISPLEFMQRMEDAMADKEKPLPIFASNTREAMMGQIMSETAHACRNVIKHWLELVGPDEREAAKQAKQARKKSTGRKMNFVKGSPENTQRNVIVTGGDGELISHLIQWNYSGILEGRSPIVARGFTVILSKYVIHYGIQAALMDRVRDRWNLEDKERFLNGEDKEKKDVNQLYVSKRVAKWFKDADANGSHYYRGTITKVFEGLGGKGTPTILFHIEFDDGDEEDAEIEELDELLKTYKRIVQNDEDKEKERAAAAKKAEAEGGKRKPKSRSKKRDADVDADSDSDTNGEAAAARKGSAKPKMPVPSPRNKPNKRAKRSPKQTQPGIDYTANPGQFLNQRVAKDFDGQIYYGTITSYNDDADDDDDDDVIWSIVYDDGDKEDLNERELRAALKMYDTNAHDDPKKKSLNNGGANGDIDGEPMEEAGNGNKGMDDFFSDDSEDD